MPTRTPYERVPRRSSFPDDSHATDDSLSAGSDVETAGSFFKGINQEEAQIVPVFTSQSAMGFQQPHIPRPPNKFILFRTEMCARRVPEQAGITATGEKSRYLGALWQGLSKEEKSYWELQAEKAKKEHVRLYPDYRYKPGPRMGKSSSISHLQVTEETTPARTKSVSAHGINSSVDPRTVRKVLTDYYLPPRNTGKSSNKSLPGVPHTVVKTEWANATNFQEHHIQAQPKALLPPALDFRHHKEKAAARATPISLPALNNRFPSIPPLDRGHPERVNESGLQSRLGPDSLLLQGFDYTKAQAKVFGPNGFGSTTGSEPHKEETQTPKAWWDFVTPKPSTQSVQWNCT
ncbi:BHMG1 [Sanghuangporus vaninii]